jgi:fucose 4-O-acetylase-like acetyltransferase
MKNTTASPIRLDYLDALRAVWVFFVVCIHALGYETLGPGMTRTMINFVVSTIAVQGFYLVDGLLFARRLESARLSASQYLADSARRLLWPWLLFSIIYLAARYLAELYGIVEPTRLTTRGLSLATIADMLWWSENAPQLYFLPSLFLIRCAVVAVRRLLSAIQPTLLAIAAIALLLLFRTAIEPTYMRTFPHDGYDPLLHALGGFAYFILGAGLWRLRIVGQGRASAALLGMAIALVVLALTCPQPIADTAAQLGYLGTMYFVFAAVPIKGQLLIAIGRRTMGIYLLHMPIVMNISVRLAGRLVDPVGLPMFASVVALSFGIALALTGALEGARLSGIVFGDRRIAGGPEPATAAKGARVG